MLPFGGALQVRLQPIRQEKVIALNSNPRTRAAATRILNQEARALLRFAEAIARDEFVRDRAEFRRPPESRGKPHYVDSFFLLPNEAQGINRQRVRFGNSHPAANIIENGAPRHDIVAGGTASGTGPVFASGHLRFPFDPPVDRSKRAQTPGGPPGAWAVNRGERIASMEKVDHPGSPAFHIFRRARERYRQANRSTPRRRG